ncbi:hypothetical protein ALC53_02293 [Atta colombica]|uniref:Uncharacterized protein n=1 Tax=Atta colombica TaxID=520822 RepID=A0A195BR96_9HYME|nr:hypothetical protein ALC53_02293 [Atta colombica]
MYNVCVSNRVSHNVSIVRRDTKASIHSVSPRQRRAANFAVDLGARIKTNSLEFSIGKLLILRMTNSLSRSKCNLYMPRIGYSQWKIYHTREARGEV